MKLAEYIWLDGTEPTKKLRSKTRVISEETANRYLGTSGFPEWGFDGSSTGQSEGNNSDLKLVPVRRVDDPIRGKGNHLILCEVPDHPSNTRAGLRATLEAGASEQNPWFGFEQEYTMFEGHRPLGWPKDIGVMPPQGPYYCGVGADQVFGRELVEAHLKACLDAGLLIYGANFEVMPGQAEFQVGYRPGIDESADPLLVSDHLWLARWLLYRLGENQGISVTVHPKPKSGDWNGAGMHTNFSTNSLRDPESGPGEIQDLRAKFEATHDDHIAVYGDGNEKRLTGLHETCDINTFRMGPLDRGASIRIPEAVVEKGYGYLEDRRPAANADPYEVCTRILTTICN